MPFLVFSLAKKKKKKVLKYDDSFCFSFLFILSTETFLNHLRPWPPFSPHACLRNLELLMTILWTPRPPHACLSHLEFLITILYSAVKVQQLEGSFSQPQGGQFCVCSPFLVSSSAIRCIALPSFTVGTQEASTLIFCSQISTTVGSSAARYSIETFTNVQIYRQDQPN